MSSHLRAEVAYWRERAERAEAVLEQVLTTSPAIELEDLCEDDEPERW